MATTNINVRVDSELKKKAEDLFNDLGLTMSSAITMFLKASVNHDGIPFDLRREIPNEVTKSALAEYDEMINNPCKYKRNSSIEEYANEILSKNVLNDSD